MTFHSISHPDDAGDGREAFDLLLAGDGEPRPSCLAARRRPAVVA
jgi:hypothetical protein